MLRSTTWARRPLMAIIAAFALYTGCDGPTDVESSPSTIRLSKDSLALSDGASDTLSATVLDQHGSEVKNVRVGWSSSDSSIASVSGSGVVSANRPGTAQITASVSRNGGSPLTRSATVTVRPVATQIAVVPSKNFGAVGTVLDPPVRFRVLDRHGNPVAGIRVEFVLVSGGGSLSAPSALTDSLGYASTTLTFGPALGLNQIEARITGTSVFAQFFATAKAPLALEPDSVILAGPGCETWLVGKLKLPSGGETLGARVDFSIADSTVASMIRPTGGTGSYRGQSVTVQGRQAGSTQIVASFEGITDTAVVRVVAPDRAVSVVTSALDTLRLRPGFVFTPTASVFNQCSRIISGAAVQFASTNPRVLTVDASGQVKLQSPGEARLIARYGELADTTLVLVKDVKLSPADTTIAVGDAVQYRFLVAEDSTWTYKEVPGAKNWRVEPTSVASITSDGKVTGIAPGSVTVIGVIPWSDWIARAKLQVVSK
jgi:hypothetical protein